MTRISFQINACLEGNLEDLLKHDILGIPLDVPQEATTAPTLEEVLKVLGEVTFIAETVAHLNGQERAIIPTTDRAREIIAALQPKTL